MVSCKFAGLHSMSTPLEGKKQCNINNNQWIIYDIFEEFIVRSYQLKYQYPKYSVIFSLTTFIVQCY